MQIKRKSRPPKRNPLPNPLYIPTQSQKVLVLDMLAQPGFQPRGASLCWGKGVGVEVCR